MKNKTITINNWQDEIGKSRYVGFEDMRLVNLEEPGVVKINYKPTATTEASDAIAAIVKWIGYGRTSASAFSQYAVGSGLLAYYHVSNGWTAIASASLPGTPDPQAVAWGGSNLAKDFLFCTNGANVRVFDCSDNGLDDADIISTLDANRLYSPMIVASNDRVYIGNGRYVAELYEVAGQTFDPTNTATFAFDNDRLDLPSKFQVSCLAELGDYLVIGTKNSADHTVSTVFMWDKVSTSFEQPIVINTPGGVNQVIVHKGMLFIQAGSLGDWYCTAGQIAFKCAEIPAHIRGAATFTVYSNARCIAEDKLFFGLSTGGASGGLCGVWSFDTRKVSQGNILNCRMEHLISTLNDGTTENVEIGAMISASGKGLRYSWSDATGTDTFGIDSVNAGFSGDRNLFAASNAYIITPFYQIGERNAKRTVLKTEIQLAKALAANESVVVQYRTERNGSWTDYHTMSADQSDVGTALDGLERIQWKIILDTGTSETGPELLSFSFTLN